MSSFKLFIVFVIFISFSVGAQGWSYTSPTTYTSPFTSFSPGTCCGSGGCICSPSTPCVGAGSCDCFHLGDCGGTCVDYATCCSTQSPTTCGGVDPGPSECGNGIPEIDEECDDGNLIDGDGCSADCQIEQTCYQDQDGDGYTSGVTETVTSCSEGYKEEVDLVNILEEDCDDQNPLINPGATERCNGYDDNCNDDLGNWDDLPSTGIDEGDVCSLYCAESFFSWDSAENTDICDHGVDIDVPQSNWGVDHEKTAFCMIALGDDTSYTNSGYTTGCSRFNDFSDGLHEYLIQGKTCTLIQGGMKDDTTSGGCTLPNGDSTGSYGPYHSAWYIQFDCGSGVKTYKWSEGHRRITSDRGVSSSGEYKHYTQPKNYDHDIIYSYLCTQTCYQDQDGDGYTSGVTEEVTECSNGFYVETVFDDVNQIDCDDNDDTEYPGVAWFYDGDSDGYMLPDSDRVCSRDDSLLDYLGNSADYNKWINSVLGEDCRDDLFNVNPGVLEEKFNLCTNGLDDNCNSDFDSDDVSCKVDCTDPDVVEVLRYSNHSIINSLVNQGNDYEDYFPLCLDNTVFEEGLKSSCTDGFEEILAVDPNTGLVSVPLNATSNYDEFICARVNDCEVLDSCPTTHTAIASLTGVKDANLTGPEFDYPGSKKLCCIADEVGISFDLTSTVTKNYSCSFISDGICPEDFEDQDGNRVSCGDYEDPDCGGSSNVRNASKWSNFFTLDFSEKSYVISAENSNGSLVLLKNQTDDVDNNIYTYDFRITSDKHFDKSETVIQFSYGSKNPAVKFDGEVISSCLDDEDLCYLWDELQYTLTVRHSLSVHTLGVSFTYSELPLILIYIVLFAVLVPAIFILASRKTHLKLKFNWKKLKQSSRQSDFDRLVDYVNQRRSLGHDGLDIKKDLLNAGWKKHIVEIALNDLHKKENKGKLEGYISACIDAGIRRTEIYTTLISMGWDREDVDEIFKGI